MLIAIPSKNRAGRTKSQEVLKDATFFVPETEVIQYEGQVKNIVGVPKEIQGITSTRNWILKQSKDQRVVFVDDDLKSCGYRVLQANCTNMVQIKDQDFWLEEFQKLFDLTEQLNYKIWGLKTESSTRSTYPYKPINFQSYVTANCMGIINDGEYYFDESFRVKEDYEICLRHIQDKGGILAIRYLHWENEHWSTEGGCRDYRTIELERKAIIKLIKMYPSMVHSAKRENNEFTIKLNF